MALDANGQPLSRISERKLQHLRLSLEASVQSTRSAGFERYALPHCALPDLDLDAIDVTTTFLTRRLRLPVAVADQIGFER